MQVVLALAGGGLYMLPQLVYEEVSKNQLLAFVNTGTKTAILHLFLVFFFFFFKRKLRRRKQKNGIVFFSKTNYIQVTIVYSCMVNCCFTVFDVEIKLFDCCIVLLNNYCCNYTHNIVVI